MNTFLMDASLYLLIPFAILGPIDGIYIHLIKQKLQENPDSRLEHITHTIRAFLFIPIALLLFIWNVSGPLLYVLMGILAFDLLIELADLIEEKRSRMKLGGLPQIEYIIHMTISTSRVASFTLALASKPVEAWFGTVTLPENSAMMKFAGEQFLMGGVVLTFIHVLLIFKPMLVSQIESKFKAGFSKA